MIVNIIWGEGKNGSIITNEGRFHLSRDLANVRELGVEASKQKQLPM